MNKVRIPLPLSYLSIDVQLFKSTTRNHRQPTTAVTMARHRERAVDLPVPRSQEPDPASRHTANGPKASHTGSSFLHSRRLCLYVHMPSYHSQTQKRASGAMRPVACRPSCGSPCIRYWLSRSFSLPCRRARACGWPHRNMFMFASSYAVLLLSGLSDTFVFSLTGIIRVVR